MKYEAIITILPTIRGGRRAGDNLFVHSNGFFCEHKVEEEEEEGVIGVITLCPQRGLIF